MEASGLESTPGGGMTYTDGGAGSNGRGRDDDTRQDAIRLIHATQAHYETVDEKAPLLNQPDWGDGKVK